MSEICNAYAPVKRETGGSPVRTRHCKRGAKAKIVTGKPGRRLIASIRKSGDLPFAGTEDTIGILRPRDPGGTNLKSIRNRMLVSFCSFCFISEAYLRIIVYQTGQRSFLCFA